VSGNPAAIALGQALFVDAGLSPDGRFACASCHDPARAYADGQALATGRTVLKRNTLSLVNVGAWRWFAWDGGGDTLWGQSLRPILDPAEMGGSLAQAAARLRGDADLACRYRAAFGEAPGADDERVAVDAAKALAAFQETVVSGAAPFDAWRDALARGDDAPDYPVAARRGAKLFVGVGQCATCHTGPLFSNREFHDIGVPYFIPEGGVDSGRHAGIQRLRQARYGCSATSTTRPRRASAGRSSTSSCSRAISASSACRRCATWSAARPTCTTAARRACTTSCATIPSSTRSASTPTASGS